MTTNYDRDTLYARLGEVASLAGELRYVDAVLAFIAAEDQIGGAGPGPRTEHLTVYDIGRTFPFSRTITKQPMPWGFEETVSEFLEAAAEDARRWQETNHESLLRTIEPVTHPDTSHYDPIVESLSASYATLSADPTEGEVPPEGTAVIRRTDFGLLDPEAWRGHAASNFRDNFYLPFKYDVRATQAAYTKSVAAGFVRAKAIDELAQISLLDAATATREALRDQLRHRQLDTGAVSTATALIIAAVGTSILATISAPAAPVSATMATISGLLYYAGSEEATRERAREEDSVEGQSADDLFFGFFDQVGTIASRRRGHYDTLDADLGSLLEWAAASHHENGLIPLRPDIAERHGDGSLDPDLDEFRSRSF